MTNLELLEFYLDWANNFISVAGMSAHYDISEDECTDRINKGCAIHREMLNIPNMPVEYSTRSEENNEWDQFQSGSNREF